MDRDIADIIDRYTISKLKAERIGTEENKKEYQSFLKGIINIKETHSTLPMDLFIEEMFRINSTIWSLEAGLKSSKEHIPNPTYLDDEANLNTLASIGKNSILIRDINSLRVGLKNIINKLTQTGFIDTKKGHLSE